MVCAGHRAVMLYLVQRTDAEAVTLAADLDPAYAAAFAAATRRGVEVLAFGTRIDTRRISLGLGPAVPCPRHELTYCHAGLVTRRAGVNYLQAKYGATMP